MPSFPILSGISSRWRQILLFFVLLAPSLWMLAKIPPLWRDFDAYWQVTQRPVIATYGGHAPLYCYAARIPLFLGAALPRQHDLPLRSGQKDILDVPLTDAGVWLLIALQHLALSVTGLVFILTISGSFVVRLFLALIWASNCLLYTFAHCVGSESLGMILVIVVATTSLRLVRSREWAEWKCWYVNAVALWAAYLARYVNIWLALLLPLTFFLMSVWHQIASVLLRSQLKIRRWHLAHTSRHLHQAAIALLVAIVAVTMANVWVRGVARKTPFEPHSRLGATFLWRLSFLKSLSAGPRAALLNKVSKRTDSEDARTLFPIFQEQRAMNAFSPQWFIQNASRRLLRKEPAALNPREWQRLDAAQNKIALAFISPPTAEHLDVAAKDFRVARRLSPQDISTFLFGTTTYYFDHKTEMPLVASLRTFNQMNAAQIRAIPNQHLYFGLWHTVTYNRLLGIWLAVIIAFAFLGTGRQGEIVGVLSVAVVFVVTGLLMALSTCFITEFIPRYGLPMWDLLFLSLLILLGTSFDALTCASRR